MHDEPRPVRDVTRRWFEVDLVVLAAAGVQCSVLARHTDRWFAWTVVPPLSAAVLGAGYLGSIVMVVDGRRARRWVDARVVLVSTFVFATLTLVVTPGAPRPLPPRRGPRVGPRRVGVMLLLCVREREAVRGCGPSGSILVAAALWALALARFHDSVDWSPGGIVVLVVPAALAASAGVALSVGRPTRRPVPVPS